MPIKSAHWSFTDNGDGTTDHFLLAPEGTRSDIPVFAKDSAGNVTGLVGADGSVIHDADFGHARGLRHSQYYNLMRGEVIDFPSASINTSGGSGVIGTERNAYGGITHTLTVGATLNNVTNVRTTVLPSLADLDIDGSPFVVVMEIVSGITEGDTIRLSFSTNLATNSYYYSWGIRKAYRIGNLYYFVSSAAMMTLSGTLAWTDAMTAMQVGVTNKTGGAGTGGVVKIHGVFRRLVARPKLIIDFDDADDTVYTQVFPYMAKYGLVGNVGVIADLVGTAGYCTEAQLDEMYAAGWDMIVHGEYAHTSGTLGTLETITADIAHNKAYVSARWPRAQDHYILPTGAVDVDSEAALLANGMKTSRATVYSQGGIVTAPWGLDGVFTMPGRGINETNNALNGGAYLLQEIDNAIACGCTARQFGHIVVKTVTSASTEISITEWRAYVDGINERVRDGKIDVVTISQWARWMGL